MGLSRASPAQVPSKSSSPQQPDAAAASLPGSQPPPTQPSAAAEAAIAADPLGDLLGEFSASDSQPQQAAECAAGAAAAEGQSAALPAAESADSMPAAEAAEVAPADGSAWVPLQLALGLPLAPEPLNELVCRNALVGPDPLPHRLTSISHLICSSVLLLGPHNLTRSFYMVCTAAAWLFSNPAAMIQPPSAELHPACAISPHLRLKKAD